MSQQIPEGWYDDPAGDPQRERFWDGASWSSSTRLKEQYRAQQPAGYTPTGRFNPQADVHLQTWRAPSGEPVTPPKPKRNLTPWILGALALAVVGALVAAVLIFKPFKKVEPTDSPSPDVPAPTSPAPTLRGTTTPTAAPTTPQPSSMASRAPAGTLDCTKGVYSTVTKATTYTSSGLSYHAPRSWDWRYDRSQWTWLDDPRVWGRTEGSDEDRVFLGVALGGVSKSHGFTDPETAAAAYLTCITSYGAFNDMFISNQMMKEITLDGVPGVELSFDATDPLQVTSHGTTHVIVRIYDVGRTNQLATIAGWYPSDMPNLASEVEAALGSARKD